MPAKRTIKAGLLVKDIRAGMTDSELMEKYKLSVKGLQSLFQESLYSGVLRISDFEDRWSSYAHAVEMEDDRGAARISTDILIPVCEHQHPEKRGTILDITDKGLRVKGINTTVGEIKILEIPQDELVMMDRIVFQATCRWVKKGENGAVVAGFEMEKPITENWDRLSVVLPSVAAEDHQPVDLESIYDGRATQSVDLANLFTEDVTESGSFSFSGVRQTWFGKLLQALPIPAVLIDESFNIVFVNQSCFRISIDYRKTLGRSFASLFPNPEVAQEAELLLSNVFETRKGASSQALMDIEGTSIWARMYLRSVRVGMKRSVLLLIEDLTLEKQQILLKHKLENDILNERNELEKLAKKLVVELRKIRQRLRDETAERKRQQKLVYEREADYRLLAEILPHFPFVADAGGLVTFSASHQTDGLEPAETESGAPARIPLGIVPEDRDRVAQHLKRAIDGEEVGPMECSFELPAGGPVPVLLFVSHVIKDEEVVSLRGVAIDYTMGRIAFGSKSDTEGYLTSGNFLVREIHRRAVKNLEVIAGLLQLQSRYANDDIHKAMFKESEDRVRAIRIADELLYRSPSKTHLAFHDYVSGLWADLSKSYDSAGGRIVFHNFVEDATFGIGTAVPLGFIMTELFSNCLKHAFPDGGKGRVRVFLRKRTEKGLQLIVDDTGVGMPGEVDWKKPESLGLELIRAFAQKVQGEIRYRRNEGTEFRLTFEQT
jgi:PAS domain S-box-containing protein